MRTPKVENLSNDELAERFKQLSFQQADAETGNDMRTYNQRSHQLKDIAAELTRRGPEARRALIPLLDCSAGPWRLAATAQCRYNAARELLAIEPARARAALEQLAKKNAATFQMALARGTLGRLDGGTFKPT